MNTCVHIYLQPMSTRVHIFIYNLITLINECKCSHIYLQPDLTDEDKCCSHIYLQTFIGLGPSFIIFVSQHTHSD